MTLDKPCLSVVCEYKNQCAVHEKSAAKNLHRQYIDPIETGDACHFFQERKKSWGVGQELEGDD